MKFQKIRRHFLFLALLTLLLGSQICTLQAAAKTGWKKVGSTYYYYLKNGTKATNRWVKRNGKKVFVGEDGRIIQNFNGGWQKIGGKWYYYTKSGKKKTGWLTYRGKRYYLGANGARVTKWQTIKNKTYYFNKTGELRQSGWVKRGSWYYYCNENGKVNTTECFDAKGLENATKIHYQTGTIRVDIEKKSAYSANYWVAVVHIQNVSQMKATLSYGTYGGTRELLSHNVTSIGAIVGINGSAFSYSSGKPGFDAVMIKDGIIYNRALGTSYSLMAISNTGIMFNPAQGLSADQLLALGVRDTFNFGPVLIKDGQAQPIDKKNFYLTTYKDPRTVVGMVTPGKYVLLVADGRGSGGSLGLSHNEMIQIMQSYGCQFAYNLDSGGSSTMVYRGTVLNHPSDGAERACGDFLCFTR
jgi:exopolysaccharide biosynthesis protein